ncbi:MAG TPA: hypothetical protein VK926_06690 [Gaiellaceae bacterium]|nr:hypothetical protein [Gaiellaceae bacterium]
MEKRTLAIVIGALILFVGVLAGTLAATSSSDAPVHTLPGGQVHTGQLPPGATTMDDDMTMTEETTNTTTPMP